MQAKVALAPTEERDSAKHLFPTPASLCAHVAEVTHFLLLRFWGLLLFAQLTTDGHGFCAATIFPAEGRSWLTKEHLDVSVCCAVATGV